MRGRFAARGEPPVRGLATDVCLDRIEPGDAAQRLFGNRRPGGLGHVVELAPRVRPAGCERHFGARGNLLEPGIPIDMKNTLEVPEMGNRSLSFPVRREQEHCSGRVCSAPAALLTGIDPEPTGPGLSAARIEHRNRRIVGEQMVRSEHVRTESFMQGFQPPAGPAHPVGKR